MRVEKFVEILGSDFYAGVPDSQLKALCNYLINTYGVDGDHHIIAANEGNCTAIAAGYHLATGKVPVVYMQNSGEGNIINPVASLLNEKVYGIPCISRDLPDPVMNLSLLLTWADSLPLTKPPFSPFLYYQLFDSALWNSGKVKGAEQSLYPTNKKQEAQKDPKTPDSHSNLIQGTGQLWL